MVWKTSSSRIRSCRKEGCWADGPAGFLLHLQEWEAEQHNGWSLRGPGPCWRSASGGVYEAVWNMTTAMSTSITPAPSPPVLTVSASSSSASHTTSSCYIISVSIVVYFCLGPTLISHAALRLQKQSMAAHHCLLVSLSKLNNKVAVNSSMLLACVCWIAGLPLTS